MADHRLPTAASPFPGTFREIYREIRRSPEVFMPGERSGVLGNRGIKLAAVLQIQPYKEYYL